MPTPPQASKTNAEDRGHALKRAGQLHDSGDLHGAAMLYEGLLEDSPSDGFVLAKLAEIALKIGRYKFGVGLLRRFLETNPNHPVALLQLGKALALQKERDLNGAIAAFDQVIAIAPGTAEAHFERSVALRSLGRYDESIAALDCAIAIRPDHAGSHFARGMMLWQLRRFKASLASYDRAIELRPQFALALAAKAELLLLMGDYDTGWPLYEWRWKSKVKKPNPLYADFPLWTAGQPIDGKTVLVHAEFGLGDFLMLVRYAPALKKLGARVMIRAQAPLVSLFAEIDSDFVVVEKGKTLPAFDLQCPIMSLPAAFGTTLATIPSEFPYIKVPASAARHWQQKLGPAKQLRVGLMWSGRGGRNIDDLPIRARSLPLVSLLPLLELPCEFHALQKEVVEAEATLLHSLPQVKAHDSELGDFSDTAGLVQQMDLVISIDTSVAHLAGGLGKPLWVMLPYASDYRWAMEGDSTPWYPTARLFRQSEPGCWDTVVAQVRTALQQMLAAAD